MSIGDYELLSQTCSQSKWPAFISIFVVVAQVHRLPDSKEYADPRGPRTGADETGRLPLSY